MLSESEMDRSKAVQGILLDLGGRMIWRGAAFRKVSFNDLWQALAMLMVNSTIVCRPMSGRSTTATLDSR